MQFSKEQLFESILQVALLLSLAQNNLISDIGHSSGIIQDEYVNGPLSLIQPTHFQSVHFASGLYASPKFHFIESPTDTFRELQHLGIYDQFIHSNNQEYTTLAVSIRDLVLRNQNSSESEPGISEILEHPHNQDSAEAHEIDDSLVPTTSPETDSASTYLNLQEVHEVETEDFQHLQTTEVCESECSEEVESSQSHITRTAHQSIGLTGSTVDANPTSQLRVVDNTVANSTCMTLDCLPSHLSISELTKEDMEMIDILWDQDVDLGITRDMFDVELREKHEREKEETLKKEKELEELKFKSEAIEQDPWAGLKYMIDEETGEYMLVPTDNDQPSLLDQNDHIVEAENKENKDGDIIFNSYADIKHEIMLDDCGHFDVDHTHSISTFNNAQQNDSHVPESDDPMQAEKFPNIDGEQACEFLSSLLEPSTNQSAVNQQTSYSQTRPLDWSCNSTNSLPQQNISGFNNGIIQPSEENSFIRNTSASSMQPLPRAQNVLYNNISLNQATMQSPGSGDHSTNNVMNRNSSEQVHLENQLHNASMSSMSMTPDGGLSQNMLFMELEDLWPAVSSVTHNRGGPSTSQWTPYPTTITNNSDILPQYAAMPTQPYAASSGPREDVHSSSTQLWPAVNDPYAAMPRDDQRLTGSTQPELALRPAYVPPPPQPPAPEPPVLASEQGAASFDSHPAAVSVGEEAAVVHRVAPTENTDQETAAAALEGHTVRPCSISTVSDTISASFLDHLLNDTDEAFHEELFCFDSEAAASSVERRGREEGSRDEDARSCQSSDSAVSSYGTAGSPTSVSPPAVPSLAHQLNGAVNMSLHNHTYCSHSRAAPEGLEPGPSGVDSGQASSRRVVKPKTTKRRASQPYPASDLSQRPSTSRDTGGGSTWSPTHGGEAGEQQRQHQDQQRRDERVAKDAGLAWSAAHIAQCSVDEFNAMLTARGLSEAQRQLLRDIRRRGKNKLAAQNCRQRKLDYIQQVEKEVEKIREKETIARQKYKEIEDKVSMLRTEYETLARQVLASLTDDNGQPLNQQDYILEHTTTGHTFVVPRTDSAPSPRSQRKAR